MKHSITLLLLIGTFATVQCQSQKHIDKCQLNNEKSAQFIYDYQMTDNLASLDSALHCINEVFGTCEIDYGLAMRKVWIYTEKRDYQKAIDFIDSLDSNLYYIPYYKDVMSLRMRAMKSQYDGDTIARNQYIKSIILEIGNYMLQHKNEIDSFMKLSDFQSTLKSSYSMVPIQYYQYKAQLEGVDNVKLQVDSLQRAINGNLEYFEMIKMGLEEDFMYFSGF